MNAEAATDIVPYQCELRIKYEPFYVEYHFDQV